MKISIIGAGSGSFSLKLVKDICISPFLPEVEVCFMDIDESRLNNIFQLGSRYAEEVGKHIVISKTLSREEALVGADYVILTALVEDNSHLVECWDIAFRLGYRFGGSLHIMHDEAFWVNFYQLQLMEAVIKDMERITPDAWLILVSNPVLAGVTYISRKYPWLKMVGMCHGFNGIYRVAEVLELDPDEIEFEIPGVNHMVWLNKFTYKGKDAFPLLDAWLEEKSEDYFAECSYSNKMGPKMMDLYRRYGVVPIGDTGHPGGGSWGYWYHASPTSEKFWNEDPYAWFIDKHFANSLRHIREIAEAVRDIDKSLRKTFSDNISGEPMIPLIEGLSGSKTQKVIVNILNTGNFVEGVPLDFEVEIPAVVDSKGIHGCQTKPLPKQLQRQILRDRVLPVETELEAYDMHSKKRLLDLILMDPWTTSIEQAEELLEAILNIPYHESMKKHYNDW